jgi:hypothetical protein
VKQSNLARSVVSKAGVRKGSLRTPLHECIEKIEKICQSRVGLMRFFYQYTYRDFQI